MVGQAIWVMCRDEGNKVRSSQGGIFQTAGCCTVLCGGVQIVMIECLGKHRIVVSSLCVTAVYGVLRHIYGQARPIDNELENSEYDMIA